MHDARLPGSPRTVLSSSRLLGDPELVLEVIAPTSDAAVGNMLRIRRLPQNAVALAYDHAAGVLVFFAPPGQKYLGEEGLTYAKMRDGL